MPDPAPESSVTIKSFAEIMAEKRKRRLEMQAQKAGATDLSTAASVAASSSEPSVVFSSSASSLLPGNSYQLNTGISQSMGTQSTSTLVYETGKDPLFLLSSDFVSSLPLFVVIPSTGTCVSHLCTPTVMISVTFSMSLSFVFKIIKNLQQVGEMPELSFKKRIINNLGFARDLQNYLQILVWVG